MESVASEYWRRRWATSFQLSQVPMARPMAVQPASEKPAKYARPGRPMSRYPLMSEASADKAVNQGPI